MGNPIANAHKIIHHVAPAEPRSPTKSRLKQSLNKFNIDLGKTSSDIGQSQNIVEICPVTR